MSARSASHQQCVRVSMGDINAPRMTWKQIAVSIGTSEQAVRQMHSTALAKMRKNIEALGGEARAVLDEYRKEVCA